MWLSIGFAAFLVTLAAEPATQHVQTGRWVLQPDDWFPPAEKAEAQKRYRWKDDPAEIKLENEKFQVYVPENYSADGSFGVIAFVSPTDNGFFCPPAWIDVLDKKKLIWIGADNTPNGRHADHRIRMAVQGAMAMRQQYKIDPRRVYVAGFSGGGRIAGMTAASYSDVFTGCLSICGTAFYRNVPTGLDPNHFYPQLFYAPPPKLLRLAKENLRFVLLSGDGDFNFNSTKQVFAQGYQKDKFRYATLIIVPGLKHEMPGPQWLEQAIEALDTFPPPPATKPVVKPATKPARPPNESPKRK